MSEYIINDTQIELIFELVRESERGMSLASSIKREQIVLCRYCKWWKPQNDNNPPTCIGLGGMWGQRDNEDGNGFCAWGEPREDV